MKRVKEKRLHLFDTFKAFWTPSENDEQNTETTIGESDLSPAEKAELLACLKANDRLERDLFAESLKPDKKINDYRNTTYGGRKIKASRGPISKENQEKERN